MNPDGMEQGNATRAYIGAANVTYATERIPEQTTITSCGYKVGKEASRVAVLNEELSQMLSQLRGNRPTQLDACPPISSPGTVCGLFELNLRDLNGNLNTLTAHIEELKQVIGNL